MSRRRRPKLAPLCPTPTKTRFIDEATADAALRAIWHRRQFENDTDDYVPRRVYPCPCDGWHLTHYVDLPPYLRVAN